jgi:hypothetical protein
MAEEASAAAHYHAAEAVAAAKAEAAAATAVAQSAAQSAQQSVVQCAVPCAQCAGAPAAGLTLYGGRSIGELEAALARVTDAHVRASMRAEAAETRAHRLDDELASTKIAVATAAANVARQIASVHAGALGAAPPQHLQSVDSVTTVQRLGTELAKVAGEKERLEAEVWRLRAAAAAPPRSPAPVELFDKGVSATETTTTKTTTMTTMTTTGRMQGRQEAEGDRWSDDDDDEAAVVSAAVEARRAELAALERQVAAATERLQLVQAAATATADAAAKAELAIGGDNASGYKTQSEHGSDGGDDSPSGLPGRTLPTPRTRARWGSAR